MFAVMQTFRSPAADASRAPFGVSGRGGRRSSDPGPLLHQNQGHRRSAPGGDEVCIARLKSATNGQEPIGPTRRRRSGQVKLGWSGALTVISHLSAIQGLPDAVSLYDDDSHKLAPPQIVRAPHKSAFS